MKTNWITTWNNYLTRLKLFFRWLYNARGRGTEDVAGIRGQVDNCIMERVNNTLRGRERNYRGLNVDDLPMIPLFAAYYNLVGEHQATGKTPAEAAKIDLKLGYDKWNGLIKQAQKYKKTGGKIRVWENDF